MSDQEPTSTPSATPPSKKKTGAALSPKGSKKKSKQRHLITILGAVNENALDRIAKDFKKHPLKMTPLEVMIDIASNVNLKPAVRLSAAKDAAPYMHKKMPNFADTAGAGTAQAPTVVVINEVKNENQELRAELEAELEAAIKSSSSKRTE